MLHNGHVECAAGHWKVRNKDIQWTPESVSEFIKEHCQGLDVIRPTGARLLLLGWYPQGFKSSFALSEEAKDNEANRLHIGLVLDIGPLAYNDKSKWDSETGQPEGGPFCYRGDWVFYHLYDRRSIPLVKDPSKPLFLIYDDQVLAQIEDPNAFDSTPRT